jgi:hypothetical protein
LDYFWLELFGEINVCFTTCCSLHNTLFRFEGYSILQNTNRNVSSNPRVDLDIGFQVQLDVHLQATLHIRPIVKTKALSGIFVVFFVVALAACFLWFLLRRYSVGGGVAQFADRFTWSTIAVACCIAGRVGEAACMLDMGR